MNYQKYFVFIVYVIFVVIRVQATNFLIDRPNYQVQDIDDDFSSVGASNFQQQLSKYFSSNLEKSVKDDNSCDIYIQTATGLKEKSEGPYGYFMSKIDNDLCRYKEEEGVEVEKLWEYFLKVLNITDIDIISSKYLIGSCNLPAKKVYVRIKKSFIPTAAYLWTEYVKPEATHTKLKAAFKESDGAASEYNVTKISSINMALVFPLSKTKYIIQVSLETLIPQQNTTQGLHADFEVQEIAKAKLIKLRPIGPPHPHHHVKIVNKEDSSTQPSQVTSLSDKIQRHISKQLHNHKAQKDGDKLQSKIDMGSDHTDMGFIFNEMHDNISKYTPSLTDRIFKYVFGVSGKKTDGHKELRTHSDKRTRGCGGRGHTKIDKFEKTFIEDKKKEGPLAIAEYKGFIYGKGTGFGFTEGSSIFIKNKEGEYFSLSTGLDKYGFCYDP